MLTIPNMTTQSICQSSFKVDMKNVKSPCPLHLPHPVNHDSLWSGGEIGVVFIPVEKNQKPSKEQWPDSSQASQVSRNQVGNSLSGPLIDFKKIIQYYWGAWVQMEIQTHKPASFQLSLKSTHTHTHAPLKSWNKTEFSWGPTKTKASTSCKFYSIELNIYFWDNLTVIWSLILNLS